MCLLELRASLGGQGVACVRSGGAGSANELLRARPWSRFMRRAPPFPPALHTLRELSAQIVNGVALVVALQTGVPIAGLGASYHGASRPTPGRAASRTGIVTLCAEPSAAALPSPPRLVCPIPPRRRRCDQCLRIRPHHWRRRDCPRVTIPNYTPCYYHPLDNIRQHRLLASAPCILASAAACSLQSSTRCSGRVSVERTSYTAPCSRGPSGRARAESVRAVHVRTRSTSARRSTVATATAGGASPTAQSPPSLLARGESRHVIDRLIDFVSA